MSGTSSGPFRPTLALAVATLALACTPSAGEPPSTRVPGASRELGNGTVSTFARLDGNGAPAALGVVFSSGALEALPTAHSDGHRCFDADGNGEMDLAQECSGWHERAVPLPTEVSRRADVPFKWVLLNWNGHGHIPPGVWDVPHFDVHFYMEPIENVFALQRGPCGPEFMRCDQFKRAVKPLPSNYMHPDYRNVDAAAPAMGNHLIDPTAPEFHGEPFTRSWIYGTYDGRTIFYEEMLALDFLRSRPNACFPIKRTPDVAVSGYYPTTACTRHDAQTGQTTVTMEGFEYREARPPQPIVESAPDDR